MLKISKNKIIFLAFLTLILGLNFGLTNKAEAATGDITAVRIHPMGWFAEVDIEGLDTTGTFDLGMGANNDPTNAKMVFTVTSQGYDDTGNATTMTRTVYGTNYVRNIYPNEATASTTDNTTYVTVRVALSEWLYSPDTATVNISSGFYTQGTANNSVTNLAVTNSSDESYPKVIANWSWPGYDRIIGATFKLRAVAFHRSAEQGRPVKAVKYTCTDQHSNTATDIVTSPSIDSTIADAVPVVEYVGTISTASLTQGDTLTCNFIAYPWYGDSGSILNTDDGVNTMPTPLYAPQTYLLDKDNTYGVTVAVVDSVSGNNTTGAAVDYASFDSQNPPAAFLNIFAAANAIAAYNNTNHGGRNNTGAGIIYLKEGSHVWTGGTVTAGGQASAGTWTTVTKFPGTTRANVLISSASGTKQVGEKLKLEDVKITNSTTSGFTGMDALWVHNSDVAPTGAATFYINTVDYFTDSNWNSSELSAYSLVNSARAIVRGLTSTAAFSGSAMPYVFLGNNMQFTVGGQLTDYITGKTTPTIDNAIYAYNKISKSSSNNQLFYLYVSQSETHGTAIVQNILEGFSSIVNPLIAIAADSSTSNPVNNTLIWNNTLTGQRINMAYNDYNLNDVGPAYRKSWSVKNNIFDDYNAVTDTDAHGGTPDNDRYGNHSIIHGVGQSGNIILNRVGTSGYENKFGGLYYKRGAPLDPAFADDNSASGDDTGNGDYRLTASSPALNIVATNQSLIPYDIRGGARKNDGTGASGAYEYLIATKAITAFNFNSPSVTGTVNEGAHTVALTVPYGTNITTLVPTITITGASVSPNTGVAADFTSPVTYTVTAEDATTQAYTVTVTVASNTETSITSFDFATPAVTGTVDNTAHTVALTVPFGTTVTSLTPTIVLATGATISPNTGVATDFTNPVTYTVTAQDGTTQQTYTVTVTVAADTTPAPAPVVANGPPLSGHRNNISNLLSPNTSLTLLQNQIAQLTAQLQSLLAQKNALTSTTPKYIFTHNLSLNDKGEDVKNLQKLLNSLGFTISQSGAGSLGNETILFGSLTYKALMKFQKSVGLPATGFFGPMTREYVNKK